MKTCILSKAVELFMRLGFKSVTMNDVASNLGASKKTLYQYFINKEDLVRQTVEFVHDTIRNDIDKIREQGYNAIEENFKINTLFKEFLKNSENSPQYQLKKYYPNIYSRLMEKELAIFQNCLTDNFKKGIQEGLYRTGVNIDVFSRFYFALIHGLHDPEMFDY
ncbi:MAG: TetR/AcrR family transcriptional regulator, partial [Lutibacter sp.]|nr:TetR/AcrR family transcriptional regulator [Lutibacter sp.]